MEKPDIINDKSFQSRMTQFKTQFKQLKNLITEVYNKEKSNKLKTEELTKFRKDTANLTMHLRENHRDLYIVLIRFKNIHTKFYLIFFNSIESFLN